MITRSLQKPYETNCFNYETIGFNSNDDCIAKCRIRTWIKELKNKWPSTYFTTNFTDDLMLDIYKASYINKSFDFYYKIDQDNALICENQLQIIYRLLRRVLWYEIGTRLITMMNVCGYVFYHHMSLIKSSNTCLSYRLEEFVSFIGSLIGLYFGFSLIMLSDICSVVRQTYR